MADVGSKMADPCVLVQFINVGDRQDRHAEDSTAALFTLLAQLPFSRCPSGQRVSRQRQGSSVRFLGARGTALLAAAPFFCQKSGSNRHFSADKPLSAKKCECAL